jgi:hypothetical protein
MKMMTSRDNIERIRQIMLVQMNAIVICDIGDESIIESWLMCGLPDGWTNDDLVDIAEDDDMWTDVVECFARCCKRAGILK